MAQPDNFGFGEEATLLKESARKLFSDELLLRIRRHASMNLTMITLFMFKKYIFSVNS